MIKTGLYLTPAAGATLIRLLLRHPDVDLRWVAGTSSGRRGLGELFDELTGESDMNVTTPDWEATDLYIGPATAEAVARVGKEGSTLKAIFTDAGTDLSGYGDEVAALGVAEYNRKALVRGARIASQPSVVTLLCALALMPLAKHLLLGPSVTGTVVLPGSHEGRHGTFTLPGQPLGQEAFAELRETILCRMQTSCNTGFTIFAAENAASTFAGATLALPVNMRLEEIVALYHDFYDDHRHVVVAPSVTVTEAMVAGTNKSVISLRQGDERTLYVSVGFDAAYKAGAGNVVHLLNLLFGLDERTGL